MSKWKVLVFAVIPVLICLLPAAAQSARMLTGTVVDQTGAAVPGAQITVRDGNGLVLASAVSKSDGSFSVSGLLPGRYEVVASAERFQPAKASVQVSESSPTVAVALTLSVELAREQVTVTAATRSEANVQDLPISASVLGPEVLNATPAQSLDQLLLETPGVNLGEPPSFAQHPTSNAISMRGLGGERALVLLDGIPLNDAFFGYVQWNRVPMEAIERAEIVRGGASSLWGNYAMSGVINVVTKAPRETGLNLSASYGTNNTYQVGGAGDLLTTSWMRLSLRADRFSTDGYNTTPKDQRGPLDVPTSFQQNNLGATALFGGKGTVDGYIRGNYHNNDQILTTRAGKNNQHDGGASAGLSKRFADSSRLELNTWFQKSRFVTYNTDVPTGGTVGFQEFVNNVHTTPANDFGASAQWTKVIGKKVQLVQIGTDFRRIAGHDSAAIFDETGSQVRTDLGKGKQQFVGLFGQLGLRPFAAPLELTVSARYDHFRNYDGFDGNPGGSGVQPDKVANSFSPRFSARYKINDNLALRGAVYRAFRAPTLDNLYRGFSTTSGTFLPNSQLNPETLVGEELGGDVRLGKLVAGVTLFRNDVHNLIAFRNLTFAELPPGFFFGSKNINVGKVRSDGLEVIVEYPIFKRLSANAAYTYTHSRAIESPEDPLSVGKQTVNVPRHFAALGVRWVPDRRWTVRLQTRWVDNTFGDSDNTLPQDPHFIADAYAGYQVSHSVELFASASNLFNRTYIATNSGFEPSKLGTPFQAFAGVRLRLSLPKQEARNERN